MPQVIGHLDRRPRDADRWRGTAPLLDAAPSAPAPDPDRGSVAPPVVTRIGVLGSLEVHRGAAPVEIRRGLPRRLLCSLVLWRGRTIAADTLIDQLWGEQLPAHPSNALQIQVAYLRRTLGGSGVAPIVTRPEGYLLDTGRVDVDVDRFEVLLATARSLTGAVGADALVPALDALDGAIDRWRGAAYAEVAGLGFADPEIVRLEELRLCAQEERCEVLLALGRTAAAVAELQGLVEAHPWRERRRELLVLALYRAGRQADALRAVADARRTLIEQVGVEPGPALRALEQRVLNHDPRLDWRPPGGPEVPEVPGRLGRPPDARPLLIGRQQELTRIRELVAGRRLVTLTGPGGAGKTRLALEVAATGPADRVDIVDLAPLDGASDIAAAILTGLAVPTSADTDPVAAIVAALGDEDRLLVLDTCERVQPALAPLVERVLDGAPGVRVLATSRRPLGIGGELAWPVPPLAVPTGEVDPRRAAAFELFVERAREVQPDFEVATEDDVAVIAEVCRSLDGLPLAIELAAAQMDALSPRAVRTQLAEHRALAARTVGPDRHRTLGATTDWSIGLLDDAERRLLHRLAVLAPSFDLDAAIAVGGDGDDGDVARLVTLVRTSLVARTEDGRYRLLDTVRSHLLSIEDGEGAVASARRRHATYFADLVAEASEGIRTADQVTWLRRLTDDHANILVALHHCFGPDGDERLGARLAGDIAWAWTLQGKLLESQAALEQARSVDAEPLVRARVLLGIGLLAAPLGDHQRVLDVCLRSAELGRSVGDDETVANALLTLGVAQWATGDCDAAATTHDEAIALFERRHHVWGATICRVLRARTARDVGDLDVAEALLDGAIDDAKLTGDAHVIGIAYEQCARLWLARSQIDRASVAAAACLAHNEQLGSPEGVSAAITLLARVRLIGGETDAARELQRRALALAAGIGHPGATCSAVEAIAELDASTGDRAGAARLLLVTQRARAQRNLPLAPADERRVAELRARLRTELGSAWDELAGDARLTSLPELARSLLDGRAAQVATGRSSASPASTQPSFPPS